MAYELIEFVDANTTLEKGCSEEQLRDYFNSLLVLYKSGEKFPVNLDDVWMLVYSAKNKAVRALKGAFVEGEDYIVPMSQNGQRSGGKFTSETYRVVYMLSVPCFEYFIAKKVREVFDVYRKVFKKIATGEVRTAAPNAVPAPRSNSELLLLYAQQMVENERRLSDMERKQEEFEEKVSEIAVRTKTDINYSTIIGFATRYGIKVPLDKAATLGRVATNLCRQYLMDTGRTPDPRFGSVRTYPDSVLFETFEKYYPNVRFR